MKKLYKVKTSASTMFVSYDVEEKIARVLDNEETNFGDVNIREVEDDSSWDIYEDIEDINDFMGVDYYGIPDRSEILDEIIVNF